MFRLAIAACALMTIGSVSSAQTLDRIKESSELRIGFRTDAPPLSYLTTEGKPAGYTPTVCAAVAQGLANGLQLEDLQVTFVAVDAANRFEKVANGEIDMHCGAATITLRRRSVVDFSIPVYVDGSVAMLPAGASASFAELEGKKIGVRANTTTEEILRNTLAAEGIDAEIVAFENHVLGVDGMLDGSLAGYFGDQSILLGLVASRDTENKLVVMDRLLTIEKQGLVLPRGDMDFRLAVDGILSDLYAEGIMAEVFAETLPGASPGPAMQALYLLAPILP